MKLIAKLKDLWIKKVLKDYDYYYDRCLNPPFPEIGDIWRKDIEGKVSWLVWNGNHWVTASGKKE